MLKVTPYITYEFAYYSFPQWLITLLNALVIPPYIILRSLYWAGRRERRAFREPPTASGQRAGDLRTEEWNVVSGACKKWCTRKPAQHLVRSRRLRGREGGLRTLSSGRLSSRPAHCAKLLICYLHALEISLHSHHLMLAGYSNHQWEWWMPWLSKSMEEKKRELGYVSLSAYRLPREG